MITDKSKFPLYDVMYMNVLNEYSDGNLKAFWEMTRNVYKKHYSEYSLDVMAWKSWTPAIYDRIHRANYALFAWKFLERPKRWMYKISQKGLNLLKSWKILTYNYLITEDEDYKNSSYHLWKKAFNSLPWWWKSTANELSPQDMFELWFEQLETPKKEELLQKLMEIDPFVFEKVVWKLCEAMGYWDFIETQKSHDWWVDWIIKWDSLGFEKIFIQAKRYAEDNIVQASEMTHFIWALGTAKGVRRWIFFTTSSFSDKAIKKSQDADWKDLVLIDGKKLVDLMFKYNVWVQTRNIYEIKDIDEDFFESFN